MSARYRRQRLRAAARTRPGTTGRRWSSYLEARRRRRRTARAQPFRLPVQWVNRPNLDFRGYCRHDRQRLDPASAIRSSSPPPAASRRLRAIYRADGDVEEASAGDAVTLTLADEVDIARGDVLAQPDARPEVADQFAAHVIWMSDDPLLPGRSYLMKIGARLTPASVTELKHRVDVNSREQLAAKTLALNEIGFCNLATTTAGRLRPLRGEPRHRRLHPDRPAHQRDRGGGHDRALRCAARPTSIATTSRSRARRTRALKHQKPAMLWFTGLSGAGKSTIANLVERKLHAARRPHRRCSTATTCATASTRTSASRPPTASRTSAASAKWRG